MSSDEKPNGDQNAEKLSTTLIPVPVEQVDQLVLIARDLAPRDEPERQWTPDTLDRIAEVVMPSRRPVANKPSRVSDAEVRVLYGRNAFISRKGGFTFVHLDNPSPDVVRQRRRDFDPATFFCRDCPLCELLKESGVIVFDESVIDGEDT